MGKEREETVTCERGLGGPQNRREARAITDKWQRGEGNAHFIIYTRATSLGPTFHFHFFFFLGRTSQTSLTVSLTFIITFLFLWVEKKKKTREFFSH